MSERKLGQMRRPPSIPAVAVATAFFLCVALACAGPAAPTPAAAVLRLSGSTSAQRVAESLATTYLEQHANVVFRLTMLNSQQGIETVDGGQADIAFVSRQLRDDEMLYGDAGQDRLHTVLIGQGGIALIVNADNPIVELSTDQIKVIYTGDIWNWEAFGGPREEIELLIREEGSGTRVEFDQRIIGDAGITSRAIIMPSSQAAVAFVHNHPQAIGYVSLQEVSAGTRALRIDGVALSRESIAQRTYPLAQSLYLVTKPDLSAEAQDFMSFVTGQEGRSIVSREYVPIQ